RSQVVAELELLRRLAVCFQHANEVVFEQSGRTAAAGYSRWHAQVQVDVRRKAVRAGQLLERNEAKTSRGRARAEENQKPGPENRRAIVGAGERELARGGGWVERVTLAHQHAQRAHDLLEPWLQRERAR